MQCDFHFNGIFNILIIHTYIYVIPHFQGMSFTFNVKKKSKKIYKTVEENSHYISSGLYGGQKVETSGDSF